MQLSHIAHFRISELLAEGRMGRVYLAFDESLQREVVVKAVHPGVFPDDVLQRAVGEIRLAATINHPHVIQVYFVGMHGNSPYVVMERGVGELLADIIEQNVRMAPAVILSLALEAVEALKAANERGLVHGGISPMSFLVDKARGIKVLGYGFGSMSRYLDDVQGISPEKANYISPERVDGRAEDIRSDFYSLGATLYHALSGIVPFQSRDLKKVISRRLSEQPTELISLVPGLHPRLSQWIAKMMATDPAGRYQTCDELLEDLNQLQSELVVKSKPGMVEKKAKSHKPPTNRQPERSPEKIRTAGNEAAPRKRSSKTKKTAGWVAVGVLVAGMILWALVHLLGRSATSYEDVYVSFTSAKAYPGKTAISVDGKRCLLDSGDVYAKRQNGYTYGWSVHNSEKIFNTPLPIQKNALYLSSNLLPTATQDMQWEIEVPNGTYAVHVIGGGDFFSVVALDVEGMRACSGITSEENRWSESRVIVHVADGRLSVSGGEGTYLNRLSALHIRKSSEAPSKKPVLPRIVEPLPGKEIVAGTPIKISAEVPPGARKVRFYSNIALLKEIASPPYHLEYSGFGPGVHWLRCMIEDAQKQTWVSSPVAVRVLSPHENFIGNYIRVNFLPKDHPGVEGYFRDHGDEFGEKESSGLKYGWRPKSTSSTDSNAGTNRYEDGHRAIYALDLRYETACNTIVTSGPDFTREWELALPKGKYQVRLVSGGVVKLTRDTILHLVVEDQLELKGKLSNTAMWAEAFGVVEVRDGLLTIRNGLEAKNVNICFIDVSSIE